MAKRRASNGQKPKQQWIEGTYDPVPDAVQEAADSYVEAKRELASWRELMNGRKRDLIDAMKEHNVSELMIDDGEKKLVLVEDSKLKIETPKKPQDTAAEEEAFA